MGCQVQAEDHMKCTICKVGETRPGRTGVTLERGTLTLVFKGVPEEVCGNCGEAYVSAEFTRQLLESAESASRSGVQVDVRDFVATPAWLCGLLLCAPAPTWKPLSSKQP